MSTYWDDLEKLLNEHGADEPADAADAIIANGWAPEANRQAITDLLSEHWATETYDDDGDHDYHCQCGKWLEWDTYDLPDHQSSILEHTDLLTPGRPWSATK